MKKQIEGIPPEKFQTQYEEILFAQKSNINSDIDKLLSLSNIDTAKAIRGYLIGFLGGDLIGRLQGIRMLTSSDEKLTDDERNLIRLSYFVVYEVSNHVVEDYNKFLPHKTTSHIQDTLSRQHPFFLQLQQDKYFDPKTITNAGMGFLEDIKLLTLQPDDFDIEDDAIGYALTILKPFRKGI